MLRFASMATYAVAGSLTRHRVLSDRLVIVLASRRTQAEAGAAARFAGPPGLTAPRGTGGCAVTATRRAMLLATILIAALGGSGCLVLSLSPLYEPDGIEFDEALVGTWSNEEDRQRLDVSRGQWRSYEVTWQDGAQSVRATARLVTLGAERYLDASATTGEDRGPLLVQVHVFARVHHEGETLTIEPLNYQRLASPAGRVLLPAGHVATDERDNLLLTTTTRELRAWLTRRQGRADLFGSPIVLTRQAAPTPPPASAPPASQR